MKIIGFRVPSVDGSVGGCAMLCAWVFQVASGFSGCGRGLGIEPRTVGLLNSQSQLGPVDRVSQYLNTHYKFYFTLWEAISVLCDSRKYDFNQWHTHIY